MWIACHSVNLIWYLLRIWREELIYLYVHDKVPSTCIFPADVYEMSARPVINIVDIVLEAAVIAALKPAVSDFDVSLKHV
jgi:hypothetical protein